MHLKRSSSSRLVSLVLLFVFAVGVSSSVSSAQEQTPGMAPMLASELGVSADAFSAAQTTKSVVSHTFLRSNGSAVRYREMKTYNDSPDPVSSSAWCYYWGLNGGYTNIFSEDAQGFLAVEYFYLEHPTYGWGLCVNTHFRRPVQPGETYSYAEGITIGNHNNVSGGVIYAEWWTHPGFAESYTEDVRWPFNNEGVVADPPPDVLYSAQALWYRTNQDSLFTVNLRITLGDTMAVSPLSQGTPPFDGQDISWEDDAYGYNTPWSIGQSGCHLTSSTMAINYFADILGVSGDIDPLDLNNWLAQPSTNRPDVPRGFSYCGSDGYCLVLNTALPGASEDLFNATGHILEYRGHESVYTIGDFRDNLQNGELGILNVNSGGVSHFVLVTGITESGGVETLSINDPWADRGSTTLLAQYGNNHLQNIRWFGVGDESVRGNYVVVQANSPLHLVVTDQYGNRTGFDPTTSTSYAQIPESSYYQEYAPGVPLMSAEPVKVFEAQVVEDNTYTIAAIGTADGPFTLTFYGVTDDGEVDVDQVTGTITEGETRTYEIMYDPDEGLLGYTIYLPLVLK